MSEVFPLPDEPRYRFHDAAAGQTVFSIPYPFQAAADISVTRIAADGTETLLSQPADYTVAGAGEAEGGSYTLTVAAAAGEKYLSVGEAVLQRIVSIVRNGRFSSAAIDHDVDRAMIIAQELRRDVDRAWKAGYGQVGKAIAALPEGHFHKADAQGNMVDGGSAADINQAQGYAAQTADDKVATGDARDTAQAWAEGTEPGGAGTKSAKEWTAEAADYAALALNNWIIDTFPGDGTTVEFTLSVDPGVEDNVFVFVDGVPQAKGTYSVSGTTLTLTEAPPGDGVALNIEVRFGSSITVDVGTPTDATVTVAKLASSIYASQVEAEAGAEATKMMTALRTKQAIDAQAATQSTGTWTPGVSFGGGSTGVTYAASNKGSYVKTGKLVVAKFQLELTAKGSSTGPASVTGLPFTSANDGIFAAGAVGLAGLLSGATGAISVAVNPNTTEAYIYESTDAAYGRLTDAKFTDTSYIYGTLTYEVD